MTTNIYNMADTWNAAGTTFTAIKMNVTNTASASGSSIMDLQIDGISFFKFMKDGKLILDDGSTGVAFIRGAANNITMGAGSSTIFTIGFNAAVPNIAVHSTLVFGFKDAGDVDTAFSRIGANDLALGNGTLSDATGNLRVGSLRINQTPAANGSAATTITNGADSNSNLGHQLSVNLNGTTYFIPCGSVAF